MKFNKKGDDILMMDQVIQFDNIIQFELESTYNDKVTILIFRDIIYQ